MAWSVFKNWLDFCLKIASKIGLKSGLAGFKSQNRHRFPKLWVFLYPSFNFF